MGWRRVLAGFVGLLLAAAGASAETPREIRIATEGAFPPFNFLDAAGEPQGFEIDLARALCEAMAARCSFVVHEWDGIVRGLLAKEYDAIMSSLHITRKPQEAHRLLAALLPGPAGPDRAQGRRPQRREPGLAGGPHDRHGRRQPPRRLPGARLQGRHDPDLRQARGGQPRPLRRPPRPRPRRQARAVALSPEPRRQDAAASSPTSLSIPPSTARASPWACARRMPALKDAFDTALATIKANGVYDRVRAKYFPFDVK